MAVLNFDYYAGEDLYSDGDVEDEIMQIVDGEQDGDALLNEESKFPIVYHLSPIRENIVNWYDFKKDATVLEIGSGCGAITGILCKKCKKVISVELSKRRATINYKRHEEYNNLEIFVGNLNDMDFRTKVDYIILNGVFEYAGGFTKSENPYVDFLSEVKKYLKSDGRLLIAIENRLGLKYFAGSAEDHTNKHFLGLNNYCGVNTVKTFSKCEMNDMLNFVGLDNIKYYYPYPDYKFPMEIFTDATINNMSYGRAMRHFEPDRVFLFNPTDVFASLSREEITDVFANSFMIEASAMPLLNEEELIYAKISNDRSDEFQILTKIVEMPSGIKKVRKFPISENSVQHIKELKKNSNFESEKYCNLHENGNSENFAEYEYLYEENLNSQIFNNLKHGNIEQVKLELENIYSAFFCDAQIVENIYTEDFTRVFGNERGDKDYKCVKPANIDLILDNIYYVNGKYCVIDCEWIFDFFVPVNFIMWRLINELYGKYPELHNILEKASMHTWFGIDENDEYVFLKWALYFAQMYVGCDRLETFYKDTINIPFDDIVSQYENKAYIMAKLYLNTGDGYTENNIISKRQKLFQSKFSLEYDIAGNNDLISVRWDASDIPCACRNIHIFIDDVECTEYRTNATATGEDYFLFYHYDPYFEFNIHSGKLIKIEGEITYLDEQKVINEITVNTRNMEYAYQKKIEALNDESDYYKNVLASIQNSLIWKSTNWIRNLSKMRMKKLYKIPYDIDICKYENDNLVVEGWFADNGQTDDFKIVYKKGAYTKSIPVLRNIPREDVAQTLNNNNKIINCGFVGQWQTHNLKKGKLILTYTCGDFQFKKVIGKCGISIFSEIKFYINEMKKNGIKPYLFYLKPGNFLDFLKLRKIPMEAGDYESQVVYPDLSTFVQQNVEETNLQYISEEPIYVIVPVYNGYHFLDKLFKGIYKTKLDFKLIIINDKSTDERVGTYLEKFHSEHPDAVIIENDVNLGFLQSVNKGLRMANGHVALVNTDVELPDLWLERLMLPILKDNKIASTTPFTNSGTICSFPEFCRDNTLFEGLSVDEIDLTFRTIKPQLFEMPTGVGFCMGMSKRALQKVGILDEENFGKGYGEENDWCQRAIKAGFKNVHVCNLFVYHNHGGSFASDEKKRLLEEHWERLLKKHPHYEADVAEYCSKDPANSIRQYALFDLIMKFGKKRTLYFNHLLGGGANDYLLKKKEEQVKAGETIVVVAYNYIHNVYNINVSYGEYTINYSVVNIESLKEVLEKYRMDQIIINEVVTYPDLYSLLEWIVMYSKNTEAKLIMLMHDYFSVCPTINLLNENKEYCGVNDCSSCNLEKCTVAYPAYESIKDWKEHWDQFLRNCNEVVVFSKDSEKILGMQYKNLKNIVYRPHKVSYMPRLQKNHKTSDSLNIGVLGVLSEHKGGHIIEKMVAYIEENAMNINIVLIGYTDGTISINSRRFIETGKYSVGELPKIIYDKDIDIFFIPSIWPETFSYTTQEIMEMNMPVAVFDIGAPAERVKEYEKGIIIPNIVPQEALDKITQYYEKNAEKQVVNAPILFVAEYFSFSSRYRVEHLQEQLLYRGIPSAFESVEDVDFDDIGKYNKLIIYRCRISERIKKLIHMFKSSNKKVFYDIDDYIFDYYKINQLEFLNDPEYKDYKKYTTDIHSCMELADGYITSTNALKGAIESSFPGKPVIVNRNVASAEMLIESLKVADKQRDQKKVVLGYFSGSKTHDSDFEIIADVILRILEQCENVYLKIGGCLHLKDEFEKYSNRIMKIDFVDWKKLPSVIQTVDINLMPLEDTFFHMCKSENKWMEAALVRVPTVASYNEELSQIIKEGDNGYLCKDEMEWEAVLLELIGNKERRTQVAENAFAYCYNNKVTLYAKIDERIGETYD